MSDADGVTLTSIAHPVALWYRRVWLWLRRPRLSPNSLETIEIEIREPAQGQRILNSINDSGDVGPL